MTKITPEQDARDLRRRPMKKQLIDSATVLLTVIIIVLGVYTTSRQYFRSEALEDCLRMYYHLPTTMTECVSEVDRLHPFWSF